MSYTTDFDYQLATIAESMKLKESNLKNSPLNSKGDNYLQNSIKLYNINYRYRKIFIHLRTVCVTSFNQVLLCYHYQFLFLLVYTCNLALERYKASCWAFAIHFPWNHYGVACLASGS